MSAYALLNVLNELRKRDKMRYRINDTGARMLRVFLPRGIKINKNRFLGVKTSIFCYLYATL